MLRQQRRDARAQLRAIRKAHMAVQQAVAAEDFDPAELTTSLMDLRTRLGDSQQTSHDDFINFVSALTAKERQDLAQQLRRPKGLDIILQVKNPKNSGDNPRHGTGHNIATRSRQQRNRSAYEHD